MKPSRRRLHPRDLFLLSLALAAVGATAPAAETRTEGAVQQEEPAARTDPETPAVQEGGGEDQGDEQGREGRRGKRKLSPLAEEIRKSRFPVLPPPPLSPAWDDAAAIQRGDEMKARLIEAAGGWEAFEELGGVRYDLLQTTTVDTQQKPTPVRVHHYEPRLCHFNVDSNGYVYSEYARPSLTGPDFVREILYDDISWREMRAGFTRSFNARRTAWASVRLEELGGLMPFSLEMLDARLAFVREEKDPEGPIEIYALQLGEALLLNYYPMMVDEFGPVYEYLLYVRPAAPIAVTGPSKPIAAAPVAEEIALQASSAQEPAAQEPATPATLRHGPRVVQLRFAFPDDSVKHPPHLRWWNMDFEGAIPAGEKCLLPHKRYRWLDGMHGIDELWIEDVRSEPIPAPGLRRPWQTDGVYDMPYRCDFWDPPDGVSGLTGHDTGVPHPRPGEYPPDHPKNRGKFPPLKEDGEEAGEKGEDGAEPPAEESPR